MFNIVKLIIGYFKQLVKFLLLNFGLNKQFLKNHFIIGVLGIVYLAIIIFLLVYIIKPEIEKLTVYYRIPEYSSGLVHIQTLDLLLIKLEILILLICFVRIIQILYYFFQWLYEKREEIWEFLKRNW